MTNTSLVSFLSHRPLNQLHHDLAVVVAGAAAMEHATENTLRYYNTLLDQVLNQNAGDSRLTIVGAATEQTTNYDLFIMTGQLKAILEEIEASTEL